MTLINKNPRILFLSHGGGPMPLLGDEGHYDMRKNLKEIASLIPPPSKIVVISAHWEENIPTLTAAEKPSLIYDYYGFPDTAYQIRYPCPGDSALAERVCDALEQANISAALNQQRGLDHGVFVPVKIMYPQADIPCVQLSLLSSLDPEQHIAMGAALRSTLSDDTLVIGSGFSFHNMNAFFTPATKQSKAMNIAFENWLIETCSDLTIDESARTQRLVNWTQAPYARYCHPREEHLLPLHVCYGLAQKASARCFQLQIMGKEASMYLW